MAPAEPLARVEEPRTDSLITPRGRTRLRVGTLLLYALLAALVLAGLAIAGPQLGLSWSWRISLALWLGALAVRLFPQHAHLLAGLTGVAVLSQWTALRYLTYHLLLVGGAFLLRRRPLALIALVVVGVFVIPKELFRVFYHWLFLHDWLSPFLLAHFLLVLAYWWREQQRGVVPEAGASRFSDWLVLFLFPTHAMNPMNFAPSHLWRARTADLRSVLETLLLVSSKALALMLLARLLPGNRLSEQTAAALLARSWPALWQSVAHSYLFVMLTLSGTSDLVVLVARLFGWRLAHPFRWALLAWNPVELWRRWAIYNRRLLLTLVYFPLGGSDRRRMLNVLLTFLASGLVLHSGWVGSKYWEVGEGGWRDQTVYFLIQGLAVCACLGWWQLVGKDPRSDKDLRWSPSRVLATIGTQAFSAWVHILVMAPDVSWPDRWRLMARCFGIGWS
jgi:D-alanyl-lipoteichoic acid acyltransferase DltB (MBOAT superfamily)